MEKGGADTDPEPKINKINKAISKEIIKELIGEEFVHFDPKRDIYNITFTFPITAKEDLTQYIKRYGKESLVKMIIREVGKCQSAEVK